MSMGKCKTDFLTSQQIIIIYQCYISSIPYLLIQEEVNDADDQSKRLVQHETVVNGKNYKENSNDHETAKSSGGGFHEHPVGSSGKNPRITSLLQNQSLRHQDNRMCNIKDTLDTVRALAGRRMAFETIIRICSIRKGFWTDRKLASNKILSRISRAVTLPQDSTIFFNRPKSLKRIQSILRKEAKVGTENQVIRLTKFPKVAKRSIDLADDIPTYKGKRQPLDKIDEPSEWRDRLQPKYTRPWDRSKRQPLDRIDEPSEWRDRLQPKYSRSLDKRQPLDRIDEPSVWRDKLQPKYTRPWDRSKRQPLDRIDEPSEWRDRLQPKYSRSFEKRQPLDRIDEPSEWRDRLQPKYTRSLEKRQPLDRIDEPSVWRDKLQPRYTRSLEKRQPLDRIDEPSEWRDRLQPKYSRSFEKRQPLDRIDEPSEWRDRLQPKYTRFVGGRQTTLHA